MDKDPCVREAQRLIAMQANCSTIEAFAIMRNTADATDATVDDIAAVVLDGTVRFD